MNNNYKFNPDNYHGILGLSEGLSNFYNSFEIYRDNKSKENWFGFRRKWEDVFFTIKHRETEGNLNPVTANEMRDYLEVLIND